MEKFVSVKDNFNSASFYLFAYLFIYLYFFGVNFVKIWFISAIVRWICIVRYGWWVVEALLSKEGLALYKIPMFSATFLFSQFYFCALPMLRVGLIKPSGTR